MFAGSGTLSYGSGSGKKFQIRNTGFLVAFCLSNSDSEKSCLCRSCFFLHSLPVPYGRYRYLTSLLFMIYPVVKGDIKKESVNMVPVLVLLKN